MTALVPFILGLAVSASSPAPEPVRTWAETKAFNGVIRIETGEGEGQAWRWGLADPATGRPLTTDTRFQTGSVEKYFASIAVFVLIDEGVLALDAPISTYLPDYREDTGARLTLRALLSNTSGLPNDLRIAFRRIADGEQNAVDAQSVAEAVAQYASGDLAFEPGAQFDYALSNWLLVQHLLEQAAGMPYPQVRQQYVFDRAGMGQSGGYVHDLTETDSGVDDVAIGFDPTDPAGQGDYWTPRFFKGSYTTARDLIALEQALEAGEVLSDEALNEFRTIQVPEQNYAYGGRYRELELCGEIWTASAQSGSNGATNITSLYVPGLDAGVAILTNVDESQSEMFALSMALLEEQQDCTD